MGTGDSMFDATFAPALAALDATPSRDSHAYAALVREIGEDGAGEVRAVFWSDTCARLELFRTLVLEEHRARIGREAHSLKGTARTFGYVRLAALALHLETRADALGDAAFRDLLQQMDTAFADAKAQDLDD